MLERIMTAVGLGKPGEVKSADKVAGELFSSMMDNSYGSSGADFQKILGNNFLQEALQTGTNTPVAFCDPKSGIELHVSRSLIGVETRSAARSNPGNAKYDPNKPVEDGLMLRFQKYSTDGNRYNEQFTPAEADNIRNYTAKLRYTTPEGHSKEVTLEPRGRDVGSQWGDDAGTLTCQAKIQIDCASGHPIKPTNGLHGDLQLEIYRLGELVATVNGK